MFDAPTASMLFHCANSIETSVEDHVRGVEQIDPALGVVRIQIALAEAHATNDVVRRPRKRCLAPHHADPVARRGLAGDGEVALGRDRRAQTDVSPHVEDDEPVARAHGVAEQSGAAVVQVGDVIDRLPAAPGRDLAEADRARKRDNRPRAAARVLRPALLADVSVRPVSCAGLTRAAARGGAPARSRAARGVSRGRTGA